MKTERFPVTVSEEGVSAKIRKFSRIKNGTTYTTFAAEYILLGKRKQEWRANFDDAKAAALQACRTISRGQQVSLPLVNGERMEYLRANEALAPTGVKLDVAAHEYANALSLLGGLASIAEACRAWVKNNSVTLPRITVADAVAKVQQRAVSDNKSFDRQRELKSLLDFFANHFQCEVHTISPKLVSAYLTALPLSERSKRNHQDAIRHLNRWLVLNGNLAKGTDWMEGVQKYSKRKFGTIEIYTPAEMALILSVAKRWQVSVIAIAAFSALRHSEIRRLDWAQVELSDKPGESFIEVLSVDRTKSDGRRRLVPVSDNLKAWLKPYAQNSGPVCPVADSETLLPRIVKKAGVIFKKNALRHSGISYRVAQTGDIARVADDSGNSATVIRSNYLRRVKPSVAAEWFAAAARLWLDVVAVEVCPDRVWLMERLREVQSGGGEGLVIRHPSIDWYEVGRTENFLKVKNWFPV